MSLRRRLFLTLCLIVVIGFLSIARWVRGELRNSYSQVVEEILVDAAHLFAAHLENTGLTEESFRSLGAQFETYKTHRIQAPIFDFIKDQPTLEMYVTDQRGKVLFSTRTSEVGQDFSRWNDVYRTLQGQYGARSTRIDRNDTRTSVYFVAAPIRINEEIVGSVTVYKTESSILLFLDRALNKMFLGGLFSVVALGLLGGLILIWITLPLERLRRYALGVSEGHRVALPQTGIKEIRQLGEAFEKMRISLEGKKTVEKYTETLTHEMKSPLTAIKGAAELCLEEMDQEQRQKFLQNIIDEANRSHVILEQLLKIAALESKQVLDQLTVLDPVEIINEAKSALTGLWKPRGIELVCVEEGRGHLLGDRFLLFQAFRNILQNAIEFSGNGSQITIRSSVVGSPMRIEFIDQGTGIPAYAKDRIFEKFYSLERPDTKRKSSGLGLSFVKEVIELHRGLISVTEPLGHAGTCVSLEFEKTSDV